MADLYSVIPGLQPSAQDVLEAELLAKQILEAKYPTLDLREGTGLRDLLIRPLAVFVALSKNGMDYLFTQNRLNEVTDATPPDLVDSILSNWFLTRKIGTRSVISGRMYFSRKKNVNISSDIYFSTDNSLKFYPSESTSHGQDTLVFDSFSNEYYVDVELTAEKEGSLYNIGSGSLLYFSNFDPYFLRAEINYLKEKSVESETNTTFIGRAKSAISTRNLINNPSIDANLRDTFNFIKRLIAIGMGDVDMVRDQIRAVFEPEIPRTLTALSCNSNLAVANLPQCGYTVGQTITIDGAIPTTYNGQFVINYVAPDFGSFKYDMTSTPAAVSVLPTVAQFNDPVYIHNGGMVDVYCSDSLATAITQVSLDQFGKAHLTGPIYDVTRSPISGGNSVDTLPLNMVVNITGWSVVGTTVTATTAVPHYYSVGDIVTVASAIQSQIISSMSCTGTTVTVNLTSHGYLTGDSVTISGATPAAYNGTFTLTKLTTGVFTYEVPVNIATPGSGTMKAQVDLANGSFPITLVSSTTFSYVNLRALSTTVTGTPTASSPIDFTTGITSTRSFTLSSISTTNPATYVNTVISTNHGLSKGRYVTIKGATYPAHNGCWRVDNVLDENSFIVTIDTIQAAASTTGICTSVLPWNDFGFSQKQDIILDMGIQNANKTASFQIKYFQFLDSIQEYLDSSANRVLCADYLARGFNFYLLSVTVASYNGPAPNSALVNSVVSDYLSNLDPGEMFVMSDMVTKLRLNGIVNIQNPPLVTYKKYHRDLIPVKTGTIKDILDPDDTTNIFLVENIDTTSLTLNTDYLNIS
jgi:hypothetical protein